MYFPVLHNNMGVHKHTHTHTHTHTQTHTRMHACTHVHTCVHMYTGTHFITIKKALLEYLSVKIGLEWSKMASKATLSHLKTRIFPGGHAPDPPSFIHAYTCTHARTSYAYLHAPLLSLHCMCFISLGYHIRYFSQKTGRRTAVSLCTYGDRPGIDRCTYGVRTGVVCTYAVSFSLADAFAIGSWLLSFRLKTKFATLRS